MTSILEKTWTSTSGLTCAAVFVPMRGMAGHRCGYVGVPTGHVLHGKEYHEPVEALRPMLAATLESPMGDRGIMTLFCNTGEPTPELIFDVHGSLTFSGKGYWPDADPDLWWFGFDCAHAGDDDLSLLYVEIQCEKLASQLALVNP